jgi:hypothetical protein
MEHIGITVGHAEQQQPVLLETAAGGLEKTFDFGDVFKDLKGAHNIVGPPKSLGMRFDQLMEHGQPFGSRHGHRFGVEFQPGALIQGLPPRQEFTDAAPDLEQVPALPEKSGGFVVLPIPDAIIARSLLQCRVERRVPKNVLWVVKSIAGVVAPVNLNLAKVVKKAGDIQLILLAVLTQDLADGDVFA